MADIIKCPKLDFEFEQECPMYSCLLHSSSAKFNCTELSSGNLTDNKILETLAGGNSEVEKLRVSQQLTVLGMTLVTLLVTYDRDMNAVYCQCGILKSNCKDNVKLKETCHSRKKWLTWLLNLFRPLLDNTDKLTSGELSNLMLQSLIRYKKQNELPPMLKQEVSSWELNRRMS